MNEFDTVLSKWCLTCSPSRISTALACMCAGARPSPKSSTACACMCGWAPGRIPGGGGIDGGRGACKPGACTEAVGELTPAVPTCIGLVAVVGGGRLGGRGLIRPGACTWDHIASMRVRNIHNYHVSIIESMCRQIKHFLLPPNREVKYRKI